MTPAAKQPARPLDSLSRMTPEEICARLLYRDGLMLVVDKPAGLPVHRGPKGGENFEESFGGLRFGLPRNPSLAHRLDKDTSGCLVLGRHRKALEKLVLLFKQGKIGKTYWAVVSGGPQEDEGLIDLPLGRLDATRGWWMKVDPAGLPSQTRWRVRGRGRDPSGGADLLAGAVAAHRAHPPVARPLRGAGFPDFRRSDLWRQRAVGRRPASARPRHQHPMSKNKPRDRGRGLRARHMKERLAACGWTRRSTTRRGFAPEARAERENERGKRPD